MSEGKLVILAAGISSRMKKPVNGRITIDEELINDADRKAKSMIGVGQNHRPFLDYLLYNARQSGYTDVLVVIGEKDDSIRSYYGKKDRDNEFYGLKISYATQKIPSGKEKPIGTADALYQGLNFKREWRGSKFTVCNSDNLYSQKALSLMLQHDYKNAMIDYDRDALQFELNRIEKFAVTLKDDDGFLTNIIEKPSEDQIKAAKGKNGCIGVSMNIFGLQYDMIYPFLEEVPFHPVRLEKELPEAVRIMVQAYPKSLFAFLLSEHVPDLTSKTDILPVKRYLETHFADIAF
ncbi:MAG: sugar phosphate nucleotidyltransferase [Candidatus Kryptoniota bacterium]